jgi:hypothetical protein
VHGGLAIVEQSSGFVGRRIELRTLRARLDAADSGRGSVVLVSGEAGIGKTRLVEEALEALPRRRVLWGRCRQAEGAPAYWPWTQAFRAWADGASDEALADGLGARAADLLPIVPSLRSRLRDVPAVEGLPAEQARFRLFDAVAEVLRHLAADDALAVVLDDLHWADSETLLLLGFLGAELKNTRVLLVGTYRDVEMRQATAVTRALGNLARVSESVALAGLALEDIASFVAASGAQVPDDGIAEVREATGGNPFFLKEVLALAQRHEWTPGGAVPLPHEVREVIRLRLDPLSTEARRLLDVAAVVGREFDLAPLARVAGIALDGAAALVAEPVAIGLVGPVEGAPGRHRFSHALVEHTLYDDLPASTRAMLHRDVGDALERLHGADTAPIAGELAYHFFRAATDEARPKAVAYAVRAGDQARAALGWEDAAGHYERALHAQGAGSEPAERLPLLFAFCQMQTYAGDVEGFRATALEAARLARDVGDAERFAEAALAFAYLRNATGPMDRVMVDLLEEARRRLGTAHPALSSRVLGRLAGAVYYGYPFAEQDAISRESVALARAAGDPLTLALALQNRTYVLNGPGAIEDRVAATREAVRWAEASGDEAVTCDVRLSAVFDLLEAGDADGVERELALAVHAAEALRIPRLRWRATMARAMMAHLTGRMADAEALADRALALAGGATFANDATNYHAALMTQVRQAQGRLDELVPAMVAAAAIPGGFPILRYALAFAQVETGDLEGARATFAAAAARDFTDLLNDWSRLPALGFLAETCAGLGDERAAALLYPLLEPHAARVVVLGNPAVCFGPAVRHAGLLASTLGRLGDAIAHFETAIAIADRLGATVFRARAQGELAGVLFRRAAAGDAPRATALVAEARGALDHLGLFVLASRVPVGSGAATPAPETPSRVATIGRDRGEWTIRAGDESTRLRHVKGVDYLLALLRRPGEGQHVLDLAGAPARADDGDDRAEARAQLRELRAELEAALDDNDGRAAALRDELERRADAFAATMGIRDAEGPPAVEVERARLNVGRAVQSVVKRIAGACPELGRHLESAVRTGVVCVYTPDPSFRVEWRID